MSNKVQAVHAGCAECYGGDYEFPLLTIEAFDSIEEAKRIIDSRGTIPVIWHPHPQGGEHFMSSSGSIWLLPEEVKPE